MFKKNSQMLVFNCRAPKHPGKVNLRWLGPYILKEEVAPGTFKLKNLNRSINASTVNGHRLKPYYSVPISKEMSHQLRSTGPTRRPQTQETHALE